MDTVVVFLPALPRMSELFRIRPFTFPLVHLTSQTGRERLVAFDLGGPTGETTSGRAGVPSSGSLAFHTGVGGVDMGIWFGVGGIVEDVWGVVDADGRAVGASGTEKGPGGRFVRGGRGGSFGSYGRAGKVHAR
jgi:hypothetical protein